jgi:hypothetical protein
MFGKKLKLIFNPASVASDGASDDVTREWRYRTHPPAAELLDAAAARNATAKELADFLEVFSKSQAEQRYHDVQHDLDPDTVYVATRDFTMKPVFGAASIDIIVPKGIKVTVPDNIGHAAVYDMNDYTLKGSSYITVPGDVRRDLDRRGCQLRDCIPPPPDAPAVIAEKAASHAQNGLPQAIKALRRISLKPKAS